MTKLIKFNKGDLVQLNKFWGYKIGIVKSDDKNWYVIKGHWDIANCICEAKDVLRIIKRNCVPKKYLRYV